MKDKKLLEYNITYKGYKISIGMNVIMVKDNERIPANIVDIDISDLSLIHLRAINGEQKGIVYIFKDSSIVGAMGADMEFIEENKE